MHVHYHTGPNVIRRIRHKTTIFNDTFSSYNVARVQHAFIPLKEMYMQRAAAASRCMPTQQHYYISSSIYMHDYL